MHAFLIAVHVTVSIALIIIVLLQAGKGADLGATFGTGGSQSLFGAGGGSSFLGKLTAWAAVIFMVTSVSLAYLSSKQGTTSIMPSKAPVTAPKPAIPLQAKPAAPPTAPKQAPKK